MNFFKRKQSVIEDKPTLSHEESSSSRRAKEILEIAQILKQNQQLVRELKKSSK
ncbi:hypothetical protein [Burkholderia contaminans]|uniref:hypothetical protein n=1 Tax=Burkholderia contaminans TaxID=488447 RepID=UPI001589F97E|nr:hypothetical protein [Burkholderia contaminans]